MLEFDDVLCLYTVYDKKILQKTHCFRGLLYSRVKTTSNIITSLLLIIKMMIELYGASVHSFNRKIKNTKKKKMPDGTKPST